PSIVKSRPLEEVVTVNEPDDAAVPPGVTTEIGPVVAPLGTEVEIWLASVIENVATAPLNLTLVAPVKFVPVSVTLVPTAPLVGLKLAMVGVFVGCGGVVLVAPPPHPVTNTASASKMAQKETSYSGGRNLLASRLQARSPNNMAPIPSRRPRQEPRGS